MRLIDADALKAHVNSLSTHWLNDWSTIGVLAAIDRQITVDAAEVVRCKDCKRYGGITFGRICRMFSGMNTRIEMPEDGFCSYGERRTDDKEA